MLQFKRMCLMDCSDEKYRLTSCSNVKNKKNKRDRVKAKRQSQNPKKKTTAYALGVPHLKR